MTAATLVRPAPGATPRTGLPEWKPYVYRGKGYDTLTPELDNEPDEAFAPEAALPDEVVWPHGTYTGYSRHRSAGEPSCKPCLEAASEYKRQRNAARKAAS